MSTEYVHLSTTDRLKTPRILLFLVLGIAGAVISISLLIYLNNKELACTDVARDIYFDHRNTLSREELIKEYLDAVDKCKKASLNWERFKPVHPAQAATNANDSNHVNAESIRLLAISIILGALPLFLFASLGAIMFSKNEAVIKFSMDTIKTLLGFLTGVATSFLH